MKFWLGAVVACFVVNAHADPQKFLRMTNVRLNESIQAVKDAGFNAIRLDLSWEAVQDSNGFNWTAYDTYVNAARNAQLEIMLILGYANTKVSDGKKPTTAAQRQAYGEYLKHAVEHFNTRVAYFELYNEYNSTTGKMDAGTAAQYFDLAQYVRPIFNNVKTTIAPADGVGPSIPNQLVVGGVSPGGVQSGFLPDILSMGITAYADAISFHPYSIYINADRTKRHAEDTLTITKNAAQLVRNAPGSNQSFPIIITETGWPTSRDSVGVGESDQSNEVVRYLLLMAGTPNIKGASVFSLFDGGNDPYNKESRFGLYRYSAAPIDKLKQAVQGANDVGAVLAGAKNYTFHNSPSYPADVYHFTWYADVAKSQPLWRTAWVSAAATGSWTVTYSCTAAVEVLEVGTGVPSTRPCTGGQFTTPLLLQPIAVRSAGTLGDPSFVRQ